MPSKRQLIILFCLLLPAILAAQEFRATITGRVLDPSGAAVAGCLVQVKNINTNEVASLKTNETGNYTAPFLRPGTYSITFEAGGFKKSIREGVTLVVGQTAGIDAVLEMGTIAENVTVTAEAPLLDTEKADRGQVIDSQRVQEFPLNGRNPIMLATLSAGVNFNGSPIYTRPFDVASGFTINGGWNGNNDYLLDGAPNNMQSGSNYIALVPAVDAVDQFKINTNTYDAQYGKTSGGIVNISLKSGTNSLHGTAYEFARRTGWDANSFQNNANSRERADHLLDQYGFTVGGPIYIPKVYNGKNKSFFFVAYEGYREKRPEPRYNSFPAPEFLDGDFSNLKDSQGRPIIIYDPASGRDVNGTWTRTAFAGNQIPGSRINPIARKMLGYFPKPNVQSSGSFYTQQNFFAAEPDKDSFYNLAIKFDHNIGEKHRLFFRHASNDRNEYRNFNGVFGTPGEDAQDPLARVNDAYALDWVGTMSPSLIANVRVSWNRNVDSFRSSQNVGFSPAQFGFPESLVSKLPGPAMFGRYNFDNYAPLGRYFQYQASNNWAIHPSIMKVTGNHTVKVGLDFREPIYNNQNPGDVFTLSGNRAWTQRQFNSGDSLSGNSIASFLLGTPSGGAVNYNVWPSTYQRYFAPYVQDDWRVTRKLTLNLGLRMDFNGTPAERYNRINRGFDPNFVNPIDSLIDRTKFPGFPAVKGSLLFAGVNGAPSTVANLDKTGIQPRVGFAYQVSPKLVVRGGWGRYYLNPSNDYLKFNGFSINTPLVNSNDDGRTPRTLANGGDLLNNPFPDGLALPPGSDLGARTFLGRGPTFFDPTFKLPYVNQFSFGFQYELPAHSSIEVSYVGSRSHKLQTSRAYNEPDLAMRQKCNPMEGGNPAYCDEQVANPFYGIAAFGATGLGQNAKISRWDLARPFPAFSSFDQQGRNDGKFWYDSMQITYQARARGGLNLSVAYTYSKSIEQWGWDDVQRLIPSKGIYYADRPHVLKIGSVWELPLGRGRALFNTTNPVLSRLASGWQHTMMLNISSGRPEDMNANLIYMKEAALGNIDWSKPVIQGLRPCVARWNDNGTITPMPYSLTYGCGTDTSTYNFLWKPRYAPNRLVTARDPRLRRHGIANADMSINKTTKITEGTSVQFRAEAFNVFNSFRFPNQGWVTDPNSSQFGQIIKANVGSEGSEYPRQIQLAVKFIF